MTPSRSRRDSQRAKVKKAQELVEAAEQLDADRVDDDPVPEVDGQVDTDRLRRAIGLAERARKAAEQQAATLRGRQAELDTARAGLAADRADLRRRESEVDKAEKALAERRQQLVALEEDAKRDFAGYRQARLDELREELAARRHDFEQRQRDAEAAHDMRYAEREGAMLQRATELDKRAALLEEKELEQRRSDRRLTARENHLDQEVDDRIRDRLAHLQAELERTRQRGLGYQQQYEAMRGVAERATAELARHEAGVAELGGLTASEAGMKLRDLQTKNRQLREAAAANPVQDRERVAELEARYHDLMLDHEELVRQNSELRRHAAASMISSTERENARMINDVLQRQNAVLAQELEHQTQQLEKMQAVIRDTPPFPACSAMDDNRDYAVQPRLEESPVQLRDFVKQVRARMALDLSLYYSEADLRCFVAGLAASRLHLLQGISGIGKTRLPEAFAAITGAGRETVPVAAEWRSPQDLLGYYNSFERKFYESEFTQSLYKAQLPLFSGKPFFVVLDEMNLSHPEQYFSDLLSAMERKESDPASRPLLPLMTAAVSPAPALLRDGRALELPDNVWFIGTANHDETTVRFADKTYDRAHVLELPAKPRRFEPDGHGPLTPVSLKALVSAFDAAEAKHGDETGKVLAFLDQKLGDRLRDQFGVSWGSRLERQAGRFVPVTVAAGGKLGEAADHLLATKVLRKLSGRVEISAGDLRDLRNDITTLWAPAFPGTSPAKSLRVLNAEIRSLGQV
ncbi:AAA family ATPase [Nonomuraea bangladeshensis]|uniref:AAA family ATPase n=1 Tax=Nonomuraea bangladeshensis TaxID=404385 RepID=UPI0031D5451B